MWASDVDLVCLGTTCSVEGFGPLGVSLGLQQATMRLSYWRQVAATRESEAGFVGGALAGSWVVWLLFD